ncbi:unnamed protein product [Dracunculus medinensis]|uniref:Secreted protein n=1 Tax=Dracunculus medinensis TaxID=318479 RepID=A0A0N4UM39_DRAME|nr:unnamed protein product [Dracunculus medinensis]
MRILIFPAALAIGTIGYFIETRIRKDEEIPYLDLSIDEDRRRRQIELELDSNYQTPTSITEVRHSIVPKSSLVVNTSRSAIDHNIEN